MGGKISPIIIIAIVVVIITIGFLAFYILSGNGTPGENTVGNDNNVSQESESKPVIDLSKVVDKENPQKVTLMASASTTDKDGIKEIILPDGSSVMGSTATYVVEENGTYEFKAVCVNGEKSDLTIEVTEIPEASATNPYVPDGFTVVSEDRDVEKGFIIEDKYGNQYVWVPVESGKLTRNTMLDVKYEESNSTASALVNSVAKYYGFYIGRYEASQYENNSMVTAASMEGKVPWTNITYQDAVEYSIDSAKTFEYEDCYTALMNSYAWDTVLAWIDTKYVNYSSSTSYGNYSGTIYPTGVTEQDQVNNICDLAGNVREWTTEIYKDNSTESSNRRNDESANLISRVIRGGGATGSRTPASHSGYPENQYEPYWGFRMVLYK